MLCRVLSRAAAVTRARTSGKTLVRQGVRHASGGGISGLNSNNALFALGIGIMGVTFYSMVSNRRKSNLAIYSDRDAHRVEQYQKTGQSHPEAEAEKLITVEKIPDAAAAPKVTPIVSTEVVAEVPPPKVDLTKLELPSHVPYILVGAGTTSFAAAKAIREKDPKSKVLIIGEEGYTPYSRPPLSKQLWLYEDHEATKNLKFKASWSGGKLVDPFYKWNFCDPKELAEKENGGVAVLTNTKATKLDPVNKKLVLDSGVEISYDKCLLATGGKPRNLPVFREAPAELQEKVSLYRSIPDFQKMDQLVGSVASILVVGGGFLGSELAVGMAHRGKGRGLEVNQVFPEEGNLGLVLPTHLCKWTTEKVKQEGVQVFPKTVVSKVELTEGGRVRAHLTNGTEMEADHVVVAVGLEPCTELAESAGLETDPQLGGYRVNAELLACQDVWAAGDASCFYDPVLGRRRVEHHDHANVSGRLAGENMAGGHKRFDHQSMFWSDLGSEVGFEATGLVDGSLPTLGVWAKKSDETGIPVDDYSKGVVFYLNKEMGKIVGVLTWNLFGKMGFAKEIIAERKKESDISELVAKFELHQSKDE